MPEQIASGGQLQENCRPVSSVRGIALINTVAIPVATQHFTRFGNSRRFACHAGLAPFGKQSGTGVKTKPHVSYIADKKIKSLLTQAAKCAVRHDPNLKRYYERKRTEGKNEWLIINNVRNKMVHRIFAIVRNKRPYSGDDPNISTENAA